MHKTFLILGMALTLLSGQLFGEESPPNQNLTLGERLVYKITWLKIPVGYGEVWVKEKTTLRGREVFHIVGKVDTNKVLSKIFPMHDEIHSWIDAKTFESLKFEKQIDELWIDTHESMTFDAAKKIGIFESFKNGEKKEFSVSVPVQDVLSAFYWSRRQKLIAGTSVKTTVCADQKDWALTLNTIGQEIITYQGKQTVTLRIEPESVVEGIPKRGRASLNLTNDSSRKPLMIIYKAPFGSVIGILKKTDS